LFPSGFPSQLEPGIPKGDLHGIAKAAILNPSAVNTITNINPSTLNILLINLFCPFGALIISYIY
jgi:hypothetical protein